jgi:sec-independent protein translocase protein TatA
MSTVTTKAVNRRHDGRHERGAAPESGTAVTSTPTSVDRGAATSWDAPSEFYSPSHQRLSTVAIVMVPAVVVAEILGPDLLIVLAIVALLFGSSQLPKLARSLGSAKKEFEKGQRDGADGSGDGESEREA